jgi:uncharacterized protein YbjT (DUF2867 family)
MQLLADSRYGKVIAVVRKKTAITNVKLEQLVIDFKLLPGALKGLTADHGYCCLGTTLKTAGSKENQYVIDHDYVVQFALGCVSAGVTRFAVVSSLGANAGSANFYLRTKGEMEQDLRNIDFKALFILQPSILMGDRKEVRTAEKAAISLMKMLNPLMVGGLSKYKGVQADTVAACMVRNVNSEKGSVSIITSDNIH